MTDYPAKRKKIAPHNGVVRVAFTQQELSALISCYEKSFDSSSPDNAVEARVLGKLDNAARSFDKKRK